MTEAKHENIDEVKVGEVIDDRMREEEAESLCRWAAARAGVIVVAPLLGTMSLVANEIYLIIKLVEDRCHLAFMVLLRAIHVEITQTYDLASRLWYHLTHITVENQLRECVWIQCVLARIAFAESISTITVRRC